jgi:hypothetical protein
MLLPEQSNFFTELDNSFTNLTVNCPDIQPYETDMRHFTDTYIAAGELQKISPSDALSLFDPEPMNQPMKAWWKNAAGSS